MNTQITNSLAICIIVLAFGMEAMKFFYSPEMDTGWSRALGTLVVGYYFGSSTGSKSKEQTIKEQIQQTTNKKCNQRQSISSGKTARRSTRAR